MASALRIDPRRRDAEHVRDLLGGEDIALAGNRSILWLLHLSVSDHERATPATQFADRWSRAQ